jgi:hypothetical protein
VLGSALFAVEQIYRWSGVFWGDGSTRAGLWSSHSIEGPLLFFLFTALAGFWVLIFVVGSIATRRIGSRVNVVVAGVFVLSIAVQFVPYGQWVLAASYLRGMDDAPIDWWFYAAGDGNKRLLNRFLESGTDINVQNEGGQTALGAAALNGQVEIARILLSKGARTDTRTLMTGETPLTIAAQMDHFEVVKLLIEYGADPSARRTDGCTALTLALRNGNQEMADFLRSRIQ